jgi:hypothetical protein
MAVDVLGILMLCIRRQVGAGVGAGVGAAGEMRRV